MHLPRAAHLILFTALIGSVMGADINHAPVVNAGPDQTITLPDTASLNGLVVDDDLPIGADLAFTWIVVSGPASVSFGSPDSVSTSAAFSKAGVYALELHSSDGDLTGVDQVLITVITPGTVNQPPVVSAGPDQTVVAPAVTTLNGAVSDDGLPVGGPATHGWTLVSGPGTIDLTMPASLNPVLTIGTPGVYVLRLDASDGSLTASDQVTIVVVSGSTTNQAPVVTAGGDQSVTLPAAGGTATATVSGSTTDDGLPAGSSVSTTWSLVGGPGSVSITSQGILATTVTFTLVGTYELQLTASDTLLSASDRVLITVSAGSTGNGAPSVSAGSDQVISAPGSCTLIGLISDDGLPGGSLSHVWSMQSGPGPVTIASPGSVTTTVQFAELGIYVMQLSASDGALTGSDQLVVTVGVGSGGSSSSGSLDGRSDGGCGLGAGAALGALALSGLFLRQRRS